MLVGILLADSNERAARRREFVETALDILSVLSFDAEVAVVHARIWAETRKTGLSVGRHDLQIAATALTYGLDLVTLNVKEFSQVPGLTVRQPTW